MLSLPVPTSHTCRCLMPPIFVPRHTRWKCRTARRLLDVFPFAVHASFFIHCISLVLIYYQAFSFIYLQADKLFVFVVVSFSQVKRFTEIDMFVLNDMLVLIVLDDYLTDKDYFNAFLSLSPPSHCNEMKQIYSTQCLKRDRQCGYRRVRSAVDPICRICRAV
jgi:hypothetical protein